MSGKPHAIALAAALLASAILAPAETAQARKPARSAPAEKMASPRRKVLRWPRTSPSEPAVSMSESMVRK